MDKNQALQNLFAAARQARLSADEHAIIQKSVEILADAIKDDDKDKTSPDK